ncbi:hypothetical protein HMPREF9406_0613 [Clostridium sp. HGF2]|nr:hypothetical protein HMPREF9406_0613 [Clostridium sp. HGF2]EQJ58557.1 hypothetical protein QSI_1838 [Clostridioides difficile P28]
MKPRLDSCCIRISAHIPGNMRKQPGRFLRLTPKASEHPRQFTF